MDQEKKSAQPEAEESSRWKRFYAKYRELITYFLFGLASTLVDWMVYYPIIWFVPGVNNNPALTTLAMAVSWTFSMLFAFFAYKKWVFRDEAWDLPSVLQQLAKFVGSRLVTLGLSLLIAYFGTMLLNNWTWFQRLPLIGGKSSAIIKLVQAAINMVVNYLFSKFLVFRKKREEPPAPAESCEALQNDETT